MFKYELKVECTAHNAADQTVELETSIPGIQNTKVALVMKVADIDALKDKPIITMTQTEVATYCLWSRSNFDPQVMVGQSYKF